MFACASAGPVLTITVGHHHRPRMALPEARSGGAGGARRRLSAAHSHVATRRPRTAQRRAEALEKASAATIESGPYESPMGEAPLGHVGRGASASGGVSSSSNSCQCGSSDGAIVDHAVSRSRGRARAAQRGQPFHYRSLYTIIETTQTRHPYSLTSATTHTSAHSIRWPWASPT
eukprot:COSAG06_NODE_568_length_14183_cov_130.573843_4_plen_175_part_00